ncbi:cilia- and flagella-associated protein 251-like [Hyperolius riggenbachi]|uniref:cilia- and flagella-associated protein 251-like n=1 Tax=Hyperolius riggenbachi TaxID=752182 RepID=UPI0035A33BAC
MILLQTGACALFLLIIQCQSAAVPVMVPGQQGEPGEQASNEVLQSGQTSIEEEVENMAGRFGEEKEKQCCRNSLPHYEQTQNCFEKPRGMTEDENSPCFKAFQKCCLQVKAYSQTPSYISSPSMMEPREQTEGESGQQTEAEPRQQTEGELEELTEGGLDELTEEEAEELTEEEPEQQTEEKPEQQTEEGLDELTEEEAEELTEEEPQELTEEEPEQQTEGLDELTEEEPELQTEEGLDELTDGDLDELTDEDLEEQLEQEDFPGGEGEPLLSLQLSMQVSKPSDNGVKTGLQGDQKSPINPANQLDLEELQSGQTSLQKK